MPSDVLAPFVPDSTDPFDRRKAAHLLRRAGFGAAPEAIDRAVVDGMEATVENLFDEATDEEDAYQKTFAAINGRLLNFGAIEALQAWWVYRMMTTRVPLREKLTLFWHGHFATGADKVDDPRLMHQQLETIRRNAWGNVRTLTLAIARDPAMIVWLDGESNTREHPNENFARELMELFTCGIGHYTETDVKEAARAFTGWHRDGDQFAFRSDDHDSGRKHFLGKSGRFDGSDVVDILMQQPATLQFLARKLLRFFAAPEPSEPVVAAAAELLDRTRLDIRWFLRELFQSRYFYSPECYRTRIASPAEFAIGAIRTLDVRWEASAVAEFLGRMDQRLLAPPNVKGWDSEQKWINSSTWAARVDFARTLAQLDAGGGFGANLDIARFVPANLKDPVRVIDTLAEVLLQGDLPAEARRELTEFAAAGSNGTNLEMFRDDDDFRRNQTRAALGLVIGLPEYHVY
jgi:uncharacterized protein (DUF1800 family)